jgi:hypothetical protein
MTEHSPLPWKVSVGASGKVVVQVDEWLGLFVADCSMTDEAQANAKLIVRSVNALPDAVSALEAVRETLEAPDSRQERRLLDQIDAALAKARPAIMGDEL